MDGLEIIRILNEELPNISVEGVLRIVDRLAAAPQSLGNSAEATAKRHAEDTAVIEATVYAYSELDSDALQNHKIKSIKALRENFRVLSLYQAKAIVDELAERRRYDDTGHGYEVDYDFVDDSHFWGSESE